MDLLKQKNIQTQVQAFSSYNKPTFAEYNHIINKYIKNIDAELWELFNELSQQRPQKQNDLINSALQDFESKTIPHLHEQLKDIFYRF